jgi:hypothetical protein
MSFFVRSYQSQGRTNWFAEKDYSTQYNLLGENPIRQAYLFLKAQDEWKDAIDA